MENNKAVSSDKINYGTNVKLVEKEEILQNDGDMAGELNDLFEKAVSILGITANYFIINKEHENISYSVQRAIASISPIKNKTSVNLNFEPVSLADIEFKIRLLNPKKSNGKSYFSKTTKIIF